ncbi:MAG: hypothetical protein JKP96_04095 [Oceanicaulis sp.]|jgi:hypothetical protein|nr:hypothetical protein [Oceanicaulis sp.]
MLTTLTAFAALTLVQAAEPMIDFSGVQDPLGGEPTRVLVLGTAHLNQLPEGALNPGDLDLVLARLEAFEPDIIAIEAIGGRGCDELRRYAALYEGLAGTYCRDPQPALDALGMSQPEAFIAARARLADFSDAPSASERRALALLLYGAGEPWSAALHWAQLEPSDRIAADGLTEALVETLDAMLGSRGENNAIGVALAARLGLISLATMDDHTADSIYAHAPETLGPTIQSVWAQSDPDTDVVFEEAQTYLGSPERVLAGYRFINAPAYQQATINADFGLAAATPDNDAVARQYVSWWQTRGLRMAANVVEAAGNEPGARVLVIVGSSHKAYFDAYLDQMHDWELIGVDAVLHD